MSKILAWCSVRLAGICVLLAGGLALAEPASQPEQSASERLKSGPANAWVMLDAGGYGDRNSTALVTLPEEGTVLLLGGAYSMKGPYTELTLNVGQARWENRFPNGKLGVWGELIGPSKAPAMDHNSAFKDVEGSIRPNLGYGYNHRMELWGNAAYDRARDKIVVPFHMLKQTYEYDPKARTWQLIDSAKDAPNEFWDAIVFGAMCYDPINKEVLAGQCRWVFADGQWRERKFGSDLINGLGGKAEALARRTRDLVGACRARFYVTESEAMAKIKLDETAAALVKDVKSLAREAAGSADKAGAYEKMQLARAGEDLAKAGELLAKAQGMLKDKMTTEAIATAEDAFDDLDDVTGDLAPAPPKRGYAGLACDQKRGQILLFGGHRMDRLVADTWLYDCRTRTWRDCRPKRSPGPRYGHGLVWLPDSGKFVLVDGVGVKGSLAETWVYDSEANEWSVLAEDGGPRLGLVSYASTWGWQPEPAAALPGDVVVVVSNKAETKTPRYSTWAARIDVTRRDATATARLSVPAGTVAFPGEKSDNPRWYEQNAGRVDPAAQQAWIDKLPPNTWVQREQASNRPGDNRAWGTAVLDPDRDQILHWGGGHVAYTGNCVLHYTLRSGQFYIGHRPEQGLMYSHGQGGMKISMTYRNRAFMSGHAYHSYAYDPVSGGLVICGQDPAVMVKARLFFVYYPELTDWRAEPIDTPFAVSYVMTVLCTTPQGVVAWSGGELWRLDVAKGAWNKLPLAGAKLPGGGPDQHGMTYDGKRNRLLLFSPALKGDVLGYDLQTGQANLLAPEGKGRLPGLPSRETTYLSDSDAVLLGARLADGQGQMRWAVYDCSKNAWKAVLLDGKEPLGNRDASVKSGGAAFSAGLGLIYDAKRKLLWAASSYDDIFALRLDLKTAKVVDVNDLAAPAVKE